MAVQSALLFPSLNIKAVISRYGALDLEHPKFNIFPNSPSPQSQDVLEEYLKASPRGTVRTTALPDMPWVWPVFEAIMPRFLDFFGREKELFTMKLVGEVKRLPAIWVLHGKEDDMVRRQRLLDATKLPSTNLSRSFQKSPRTLWRKSNKLIRKCQFGSLCGLEDMDSILQ